MSSLLYVVNISCFIHMRSVEKSLNVDGLVSWTLLSTWQITPQSRHISRDAGDKHSWKEVLPLIFQFCFPSIWCMRKRFNQPLVHAYTGQRTPRASRCKIEHMLSRVKGETKRNGQRTVRVQIRLTTCCLALASMWKLVHMTFSPNVITKMCMCATTQNWTCLPQTEKMRENWRTKREAGVRSALKCRLNKCGYEMTRIGTCLEIHTRDWHKATHPPTSFTSAWYGSTLEAPVPWDYSSHTGQGTHTHT